MDSVQMMQIVGGLILWLCALLFAVFAFLFVCDVIRWSWETITRKPYRTKFSSLKDFNTEKASKYILAIALVAGALFLYFEINPTEKVPEPMTIDELSQELYLAGSDIDIFTCDDCNQISVVCECHREYQFPDLICCRCAREDYKICFLCRTATSDYSQLQDQYGNNKNLYYCWSCSQEYEDKPFCLDGNIYYLKRAYP